MKRARVVAASVAILLGAQSSGVRAAPPDVATAQLLFDDARTLMNEGRYADACPKLEESQRIAPGIGTEFNLADCYEHVGRLASAFASFLDVASLAKAKAQAERERAARERAKALEPRLARLTIVVPDANRVDGLEVKRDGAAVNAPLWGVGVPVDQGEHAIEATAPGRAPWRTRVRAKDGEAARVVVPALATVAGAVPTAEPASSADRADAPPPAPTATAAPKDDGTPPVVHSSDTQRTAAWISLGAAGVLAGVGVLGALAHQGAVSDYNADTSCPSIDAPTRPPACQDKVNAASRWSTVELVGFVGGGVALVAAVTLLLTAPSASPAPARATARRGAMCGPGPGTLGVACGVAF